MVAQTTSITVKYCRGNTLVDMGRLALIDRKVIFEYARDFLDYGLELSPIKLPLKPGMIICEDRAFDGLFGVFNDSLPDGWGRLLLDRKLMSIGTNPHELTPLTRLLYVGKRGMGALQYEPEIEADYEINNVQDLDEIATQCLDIQENESEEFLDELLSMNGSSAGARPKILVKLSSNNTGLEISNNSITKKHNDWMIKFPSSTDPKDIGSIEYAYHLMAISAGLDVPEAKLFKSNKCSGYFGVKRFDRQETNFLHMHTVSGLLHTDHRDANLDYETLMKLTTMLTKDIREREKQYRNAVFNVFTNNRDDHAKNFSFLMNEDGVWNVSPAYDLTFSSGPAGEHCTTVMGEGKSPGITHLLKLAEVASIPSKQAMSIIDQVREVAHKWNEFADIAKVSKKSQQMISNKIAI
jgi:serine/threonine-protein kinase HipA